MILPNFRMILRNFHQTKDLYFGLQKLIPAASVVSQHTCQTTASLLSHARYLHTRCDRLVTPEPVVLQHKRHLRKVYPDPFQQDPEYYLLPEEKTHLDLDNVPALGNHGPELVGNIQEVAKGEQLGRLFAVIHIDGEQRKITAEDLVIINGFFPPQIGDKIRLEKVMLVGGKDFTLFGRPILNRDLVHIEATVIEKTLSHVKIHYTKLKRFKRLKLLQHPQSVIVINSIEVDASVLTNGV